MAIGDKFRKVNPADPLAMTAEFYNKLVDVIAQFNGGLLSTGGPPPNTPRRNDFILVRNDSGSTVNRFGILGIDDMVITPSTNLIEFQNRPVISGITPTVAAHYGKFIILDERLKDGKIGRGIIMGATPVQVDIVSTDHKYADVKNTDLTELESKVNGSAGLAWQESGTGTKWTLVRLGGLTETGTC